LGEFYPKFIEILCAADVANVGNLALEELRGGGIRALSSVATGGEACKPIIIYWGSYLGY
jgi:hypothetical protein